jgi:hypothetical protein
MTLPDPTPGVSGQKHRSRNSSARVAVLSYAGTGVWGSVFDSATSTIASSHVVVPVRDRRTQTLRERKV